MHSGGGGQGHLDAAVGGKGEFGLVALVFVGSVEEPFVGGGGKCEHDFREIQAQGKACTDAVLRVEVVVFVYDFVQSLQIQQEKAACLEKDGLVRTHFKRKPRKLTGVNPAQVIKVDVPHGNKRKPHVVKGKGPQLHLGAQVDLLVLNLEPHKNLDDP